MRLFRDRTELPVPGQTLPGRAERPFAVPSQHAVLGTPLEGAVPAGHEVAIFALGCFWGAEEIFWQTEGVWSTAVGYVGGQTANPTYEEVCSGSTGHTEAVRVVFDPDRVSYARLLAIFWEAHDPTQGMRQGNDIGTQYRSGIYPLTAAQRETAERSRSTYEEALAERRYGPVTTEIAPAGDFFYAEDYHQQYLAKNPMGYRCHSATGVAFPQE